MDNKKQWETLSPEEKKKELFIRQKHTLDLFLERHAISQNQYDKSLGDLRDKMGMQDINKERLFIMNRNNLQSIFKKYIDNFEILNNEKNDETYKWEIAQKFQEFDVDAEDFVEMLTYMWKTSENLIDSSQQLPFYAQWDFI